MADRGYRMTDDERLIALIFILMIIIITMIILFWLIKKRKKMRDLRTKPSILSQTTPIIPVGQIIEKERIIDRQTIVKVRCRYCNTLNNEGDHTCISCGAKL